MDKIFWPNYLFHADFSADQAELAGIALGPINADSATLLAATLSTHDSGEGRALWTDQAAEEWSLAGVEVVYNGQNSSLFPTKYIHNTVLGIKFPDSSVTPPAGTLLYLQYDISDNPPTIPEPEAEPVQDTPPAAEGPNGTDDTGSTSTDAGQPTS